MIVPCYHPIRAWRAKSGRNPLTGKWPITFSLNEGYSDLPVMVPCGQCIGCRLERSRQWAIRCMHESSLYLRNCFITLTYNNAHLPSGSTLVKRDLTLFFKRLRKEYGNGIRYYACGEYGSLYSRPHYHACIFNHDFPDKYFWMANGSYNIFRSPTLERLWPFGFSSIGAVTFDSAAYVARYILKKQLGKGAADFYSSIGRVPEYTVMSRRPGIAHDWFELYHDDVYPSDEVIVKNHKVKPPRYYDNLFDIQDHEGFSRIKARRRGAAAHSEMSDIDRRLVKEQIKIARIKTLKRAIEI